MQDETQIEDQIAARRKVGRYRFKEVLTHEFEARLPTRWQRLLAWLERLCVVLDDEMGIGKSVCNCLSNLITATSYLS